MSHSIDIITASPYIIMSINRLKIVNCVKKHERDNIPALAPLRNPTAKAPDEVLFP